MIGLTFNIVEYSRCGANLQLCLVLQFDVLFVKSQVGVQMAICLIMINHNVIWCLQVFVLGQLVRLTQM